MDSDTADLIQKNVNPILSEFLDGFVIAGFKAGTGKKVICIKMPPPRPARGYEDPDFFHNDEPYVRAEDGFLPLISCLEEWAEVNIDLE